MSKQTPWSRLDKVQYATEYSPCNQMYLKRPYLVWFLPLWISPIEKWHRKTVTSWYWEVSISPALPWRGRISQYPEMTLFLSHFMAGHSKPQLKWNTHGMGRLVTNASHRPYLSPVHLDVAILTAMLFTSLLLIWRGAQWNTSVSNLLFVFRHHG